MLKNKIVFFGEFVGILFFIFLMLGLVCAYFLQVSSYNKKHKVRNYDVKLDFKPQNCFYADGNVNVVFITDKNYVDFVRVAIQSAKDSKCPNSKYNFYVMTTGIKDKSIFENLSEKNVSVKVLFQEETKLPFEKFNHVSKAALLKYYIPKVFPQLDKVLYIDGDTLIFRDLSSLYNLKLEDNYLAAAEDCSLNRFDEQYLKKADITSAEFYFNSGVMLMNLNKIREDGMLEKLEDYTKTHHSNYMDQDALNAVFAGKVKKIDFKYNAQNWVLKKGYDIPLFKKYHWKSYEEALSSLVICHFAGSRKPNIFKVLPYDYFYILKKIWDDYYHQLPVLDVDKI